MILLNIDLESKTPAYRQIEAGIRNLTDEGTLKSGDRLPPTRFLAQKLGVDRTTVVRAYQELWASGVVESRPGSYTTIRRRLAPARTSPSAPAPPTKWMEGSPRSNRLYEDFTLLRAMKAHLPDDRVTWTTPAGGYTLWVRWIGRKSVDEETLTARLLDGGVRVSPGRFYFPGPVTETAFPVSISNLEETAIEEGIVRMAKTLNAIGGRNA